MKGYSFKLILIALILINMDLYCQVIDTVEVQRNTNKIITYALFKESNESNQSPQNEIGLLKTILQASPNDDFRLIKTTGNENLGLTHNFYQQYYKGIKVENAEYLVHSNKGIVHSINGDFHVINTSVIPTVKENDALERAKKFINAEKYSWEDPAMEKFVKEVKNDSTATNFPKGELVICKDTLNESNQHYLTWKFNIISVKPDNELLIYVDAITGKIVKKINLILRSNAVGTAETRYNYYPKTITTDLTSPNHYRLYETRNGVVLRTRDLRQGTDIAVNYEFVDNNNNWTAAEWANPAQDQVALDAHWGMEIVLDYWRNIRKRNSYDGNGSHVSNFVHYDIAANNAGWDPDFKVMEYGDGDGVNFSPLTGLDVVAHEFGHGVCQFTAGLVNGHVEAAAINEGFSDIWGAVIERWADPYKEMWEIGDDVTLTYPHYMRNMQNPILGQEARVDTWHGTNWYYGTDDDIYSHTNMGVMNHWFYLLASGGNGWNNGHTSHAGVGDGYCWTVVPIGVSVAARLAYITEAHYLNSTADYNAVRNASRQAALDTFGIASQAVISVTNAWNAVGVGAAYQYQISGPRLLCTSESYYIDKLPAGSTITWGTPTSNIALASDPHANPGTFSKVSNGNGFIYATVDCGNIQINLPVHTGTYSSSDYPIIGPSSAPCRTIQNYWIQPLEGTTSINWTWPGNWTYISGQGTTSLTLRTGTSSGMVGVGVNNTCGQSGSYYMKYITITGYCGYSLSVSPNPASEFIDVSIIEPLNNNSDTTSTYSSIPITSQISNEKSLVTYSIIISDNSGAIYYKDKKFSKNFRLLLPNLKSGNYIIAVDDGVRKYNSTLIIIR